MILCYKKQKKLYKKMAEEGTPSIRIANKEMLEETPKIYLNNSEIYKEANKEVFKFLVSDKNKVIDLGSDKSPEFALYLANKYPDSQITHFKDTKTTGRIDVNYKRENLDYVFTRRDLKRTFFDVATAFFTLHEFPANRIKPELKILRKCLRQNGKIAVIDYDLKWVQKEKISEEDFTREIFTADNERKAMRKEWNCMRTHISLGLEDYIEELTNVGFEKKYSEKYHIKTSWGIKPKIFLYVGEKI